MNYRKGLVCLAACGSLFTAALAQPFWSQYGGNAQHTAEVTTGVQDMNSILWQTPVDLYPPVSGTDLFIHYGSPLVTNAGTVVVMVRNGPNANFPTSNDTFQAEGHDLATGTTLWTQTSDFTDWMPHDWTPSYSGCIDPDGTLYLPGAGGTVWVRKGHTVGIGGADDPSATITQECFYGMSNYTANSSTANGDIQISTPISVDSNGNIFFGFYVGGTFTGSPASSGFAEITAAGTGLYVTADTASGYSGSQVTFNCAPAISNDGNYVYFTTHQAGGYNNPTLVRLNVSDLSTASIANLAGPGENNSGTTFAYLLDDGTSSPMIGPDGDVYIGDWWSNLESRGFMLHYSGDLATQKPAGAFGWDDTASVVPASCVPSYTGTSSYLILSKYNNYSDPGVNGDGLNKVAILDPNATEQYTVQYNSGTGPTYTVMNEVETVLGPTANTGQPGVREWCINMAAIDVAGKTAVINSEDGHAYRWDLTTDTLTQNMNLEPPTGEAYTPTIVAPGGVSFAINNAELFAMWDGVKPSAVGNPTLVGGNSTSALVHMSGNATGPGATVTLTSSNPHVQVPASVTVPAGSSTASFSITSSKVDSTETATVTANRYGFTSSSTVTITGSGLSTLTTNSSSVYGNQTTLGNITLVGNAPQSGRTITLSSDLSSISFAHTQVTVASGTSSVAYSWFASPVSSTQHGHITATLDDNTSLTIPITNNVAVLTSVSLSPSTVNASSSTTETVTMNYGIPSSGLPVSMTYSAHTSGPSTITVHTYGSGGQGTGTVTTGSVSTTTTETIQATFNSTTVSTSITINPDPALTGFTINNTGPFMTYQVTGTVTLASAPTSSVAVAASASNSYATIATHPTVTAGHTTATFLITANPIPVPIPQKVNITTTLGSTSRTVTIQVNPILPSTISSSSTVLHAGQTATITITSHEAAGYESFPVSVSSSDTTLATVPSSVNMAAHTYSTTVRVKAAASVPAGTHTVTITAKICATAVSTNITVEP